MKQKSSHRLRRLAVFLWLFQKTSEREEITDTGDQIKDDSNDFSCIRCPICKWQPKASDRWGCGNVWKPEYFFRGCGTIWNTFETHGLCPGCGHQWRWTKCLSCDKWSRHEDWYVNKED